MGGGGGRGGGGRRGGEGGRRASASGQASPKPIGWLQITLDISPNVVGVGLKWEASGSHRPDKSEHK